MSRLRRGWRRALPWVVLALTGTALVPAARIDRAVDLTGSGINSVPPAAVTVAGSIGAPLRLVAVFSEDNPARGAVTALYRRYALGLPEFTLQWAPPATIPEAIRSGARQPGEVYLETGSGSDRRSARVQTLDDAGMLGALHALARAGKPWVVFLTGHGERRVSRQANHDLSLFAEALRERAMRVVEFDPYDAANVPGNTDLLVIASPRTSLPGRDIAAIERYLDRGGHLLLLEDPDDEAVLARLALPVRRLLGTLVDPASQFRQIDDPTFLVIDEYPAHPALTGFDLPVLLPRVSALEVRGAPDDFEAEPLLVTGRAAWQERDPVAGQVGFDADRDRRGPLPTAMALTREIERPDGQHGTQRVVVIGDGDMAANAYLANGGNRAFMSRIVEWLVSPGAQIPDDIGPETHPVLDLAGSPPLAYLTAAGFLFVVPLLCLARAARLAFGHRHA